MNMVGYGRRIVRRRRRGGNIFGTIHNFVKRNRYGSKALAAIGNVLAGTKYAALAPVANALSGVAYRYGYGKRRVYRRRRVHRRRRGGDNVNRMNTLVRSLRSRRY